MEPRPWQRGHGCWSAKSPCEVATTPLPSHCGHVTGAVPGAAPVPWHVWHASSSSTGTVTCTPCSASSNETCTSVSTSLPRWPRCCCCCARPPRLKSPPKMSPRSKSEKSYVVPAPNPAGRPLVVPRRSYCLRFSGSDSTSYAPCTSLNRSSFPGLRSGWTSRTSLRYAFLISSWLAFFETPSDSYRLLAIRLRPLRDDDARRAQHAVAELVALLQHLDDGALLDVGRLRQQRLLRVRVELAVRLDLAQPFTCEQRRERPVDEADALFELRLLVLACGLERTLEIVEHGHELLHEPLVGARGQLLLVARHPLAVVVELRLQPLQGVEVLVALLCRRRERVRLLRRLRRLCCLQRLWRVHYLFLRATFVGHFSSTTSYSASSTTSSSDAPDAPSPPAAPLPVGRDEARAESA